MIYRFRTAHAYYSTDPIVDDPFDLYWDTETGQAVGLYWDHEHKYGLHPDRGTVRVEGGYHFVFDVLMTDNVNFPTPFPLRGRMAFNHRTRPHGANLAAIQEGSGTAWLAAEGTIMVVDDVPDEALPPTVSAPPE